jgi:hypothetical protein
LGVKIGDLVRIVGNILAQMVGIITASKSNAYRWKVSVKQIKCNLHGCSKWQAVVNYGRTVVESELLLVCAFNGVI